MAYSVKRHGTTIQNCDSEPVQTPGCIQAHGALLVLLRTDLTVLQASENSQALLGVAPGHLLGRPVAEVIGASGSQRLTRFLADESVERSPLYAMSLASPTGSGLLDVTVHTLGGLAIVEFEPAEASDATGKTDAQNAAPDYYAMLKKSVADLQTASSLQAFCNLVTDHVRRLTQLDRVMVYKFHADGHGEVYAESRRDDLAPWLGLHYPAEDIPKPARDVFRQVWIRPMPDVAGGLAEMVPLLTPTGAPLQMTYCALRGASVMYTEYLQNMGVKAGLTLAIRRGDDLWGLIACHHYSAPIRLPHEMRAACEFMAQVVSMQHRAVEERDSMAARLALDAAHQQVVTRAAQEGGLQTLFEGTPTLLDGMQAGGAAMFYQGRWSLIGITPTIEQLDTLVDWVAGQDDFAQRIDAVLATDELPRRFAPAAAYADVASGVLVMPLARKSRALIMWFRPEFISLVSWGGNPHDKPTVAGPNGPRLTPRRSFELFTESVRQRALAWTPAQIAAVSKLRVLLMELVVSRADQLAELNYQLAQSNEELDAFAYVASHDLKEPLRGIHKYAHQLLDKSDGLSEKNRLQLEGLLRMTLRMDDLLDSLLHFSRVGRVMLEFESVDLDAVVAEAIEMVDARRAERPTEIVVERPLPPALCDRVRVREIFVNLLSNAIKYNDKPVGRVRVGHLDPDQQAGFDDWPVKPGENTVYFVADNGIGIQARHAEEVFKMFKRLNARHEFGGGSGAGLTIVRKLVDRHSGAVWFSSVPGEGSTFYFTLAAASGA